MKAQDYINQCLLQINEATDPKQLKDICASVFIAFLDDTAELVKSRNAVEDEAIVSVLNEEGDKWSKFCRTMNEQQEVVKFNEDMFFDYWRERFDL